MDINLLIRDSVNYSIEDCPVGDIINFNELIAIKVIREALKADDSLCHCSTCIEDSYALAMNGLPARYIQATSVEKYTASKAFIGEETVRKQVMQSLQKVKTAPNH